MIQVRGQHFVVGTLWLTIGTGLTRVVPIFIGVAFARMHTPQAYADFLAFIVGANLIAAIPLMGTTQLILSASTDLSHLSLFRRFISPLLLMQGISSLCLIAFMALRSGGGQGLMAEAISLYVYTLGYCITGMVAAIFNKMGLQAYAGQSWIITVIVSTIFCFTGFALNVSVEMILLYLASGWLASGLLCAWKGWRVFQDRDAGMGARGAVREADPVDIRHVIVFGLPSVVFLFGFYWLVQQVQSAGDPVRAGAFSLGYQLFSVGLFLPGVLGNVITPRLNEARRDMKVLKRLLKRSLLAYASIVFVLGALVLMFLPWLLMAFNIPDEHNTRSLVLVFQLAVVIAALQALLNQWMVSARLSHHILGSALVWLVLVMICAQMPGEASTKSAGGLVLAYIGSFLYGAAILLRKIYGKAADNAEY